MSLRAAFIWVFGMLLCCGAALLGLNQVIANLPADAPAQSPTDTRVREEEPVTFDTSFDRAKPDIPEGQIRPESGTVETAVASAPTDDPSLNSWYEDAGKQSGPAEPTPADNSFLINSAEPYLNPDQYQ